VNNKQITTGALHQTANISSIPHHVYHLISSAVSNLHGYYYVLWKTF